jgi:hypothetical protein
MTDEQWAAMNFEPRTHKEDEWKPPSNKEWADATVLLLTVRIAWICMYKTKSELMTIVKELEDEPLEDMLSGIIDSRRFFEDFLAVLYSAEARLFAAAAAELAES